MTGEAKEVSVRYTRQVAVRGIGERGQGAIRGADAVVHGDGLASEVCALYLAGAGLGTISADPRVAAEASAINCESRIIATEVDDELAVEITGARHVPGPGSPVARGSFAARWVLARVLGGNRAPA